MGMPNAAAIILLTMVLDTINGSRIFPAIDTPDLVDDHGFRTNPIRRVINMAQDIHGANEKQAHFAAMAWVKLGRPTTSEAALATARDRAAVKVG